MEIKLLTTVKGTRILANELAARKRSIINSFINTCIMEGFTEIMIPIIQQQEIFVNKVGQENQNMMYTFKDAGERDLCLAPEYTAVMMQLGKKYQQNDMKLFYVGECFRGEKPQKGRYRQFTQFGVEVLNPKKTSLEQIIRLSTLLLSTAMGQVVTRTTVNRGVTRGLDYYKDGKGFEVICPELGAQKQICGGGEYPGGVGFAIGIDRLLLISETI